MTRRTLPLSMRAIAVAVAAALFVALFGLRLFGNLVDFSDDDHRTPLSATQRSLVDQIEELRADDGLFTASVGSAARPGLYESAHGLAVLSAATGEEPNIRTDPAVLRKDFSAEMQREPLSALVWLAEFEAVTGKKIHTRGDEKDLLQYLSPRGYFRDPGTQPGDVSSLLNDTSGGLTALDRFGVTPPTDRRDAVRRWLRAVADKAPRRPVQLHHVAHIATAVGLPLPAGLARHAKTWWQNVGKALTPAGEENVIEVSYYVLLADRLDIDLTEQRPLLRRILAPDRTASTDSQTLALTARAWQLLEAPRGHLDRIGHRIRSRLLPSGLVSSVQHRRGSLTSTYEVVRLRMIAGLPGDDPRLRGALSAMRTSVLAKYDPLLRGAWLLLMESVNGNVSTTDRKAVVAAVKAAAPRTVDMRNVDIWNRYTEILVGLGEEVPRAAVADWAPDSTERRFARSLLINSLGRTGRLEALRGETDPRQLLADGEERLAEGTVREGAEALGAASTLGWTPTAADAERITALLAKRRNCPGASAFYRDSAEDTECGVPGTRAAYRISALLEGALPAGRRSGGSS